MIKVDFSVALPFGHYTATIEKVAHEPKENRLAVLWRTEEHGALLTEHFYLSSPASIDRLYKLALIFGLTMPFETCEFTVQTLVGQTTVINWGTQYDYEVTHGFVASEDDMLEPVPEPEYEDLEAADLDAYQDEGTPEQEQHEPPQRDLRSVPNTGPKEKALYVGAEVWFFDDTDTEKKGKVEFIDGNEITVIDEENLDWTVEAEDLRME